MRKLALLALLGLATCSTDAGPRASAQRVMTRQQLIGGPKAVGQIGDYIIQNDKIRAIVQDTGDGRVAGVFGGSLIDVDLQRPNALAMQGLDTLGELFPTYLLEAMNPESVRVTADGHDGGPAAITVTGKGGNLLQMVAILNTGLLYPPDLTFSQEYKLSPGASYIEITTTIANTSAAEHPMPYLDPQQLKNSGLDIPGIDMLMLSVPMGEVLIFGAENAVFATGAAGFNFRFGIEDSYQVASGFPAFPGMVTGLVATRGPGLSFGLAAPSSPDNYATAYKKLYEPAQPTTDSSLVVPFLYAAVTAAYFANPPPILHPGDVWSYKSYLIVGSGDVASVTDTLYAQIRNVDTGVFAGLVVDSQTQAPVPHAMIIIQDTAMPAQYVTEIDTNEYGLYRGHLPAGDYTYRVVTNVRDSTPKAPLHIDVDQITNQLIQLDPPGHLAVEVVDELGRPVPCKIALVGHFGAQHLGQDPRKFLYDLHLGENMRPTTYDPQRDEYIENTWFSANGLLNADVRPGTYDLSVSRGMEYDLHSEPVVIQPGTFVTSTVRLVRSVDTSGYVAADLHLHSVNSVDSNLSLADRVTSIAAEGLEFVAATNHNFLTDYAPTIAALGLDKWVTSVVGLELTTFEMGHFNGYPLQIDPGNVRGGDFKWAGQTPDELFDNLRNLGASPSDVIVEVNHARDGVLGYFTQFNLDTETGMVDPRTGLRAVFAPFHPEFAPSNFSYDFDTLEVLNGKRLDLVHAYRAPNPLPPPPLPSPPPNPGDIVRDSDGHVAFPGQVDDWFTFLNMGLTYTAVGNSDSHGTVSQEPGYARTLIWVGAGKDKTGAFTKDDVMAGLRAHRAIVTLGPMIDLTVDGQPIGSTVTNTSPGAAVTIHASSANYDPFTHVNLWANGTIVQQWDVPAGQQNDFSVSTTLPLTRDVWVVAEVTGTANMFPVCPPQEFEPLNVDQVINALGAGLNLTGLDPAGNLKPAHTFIVTPLALTNPIWIDHDGDGKYTPILPGPPPKMTRTKTAAGAAAADVRKAFANLKEGN